MKFVTMLIETIPVDDFKLNLVTSEAEYKIPELIDKLNEIKDYDIEFDPKIRDFHERRITTDTG